ncbi:type II toxin-antitoxin system RelE/ParE family toxin [Ancylobacter sp. 6x-1]|uniref:Type II toxin-antitoxin system RelE/ParE family toxin n=1 Tax=Ancylobacter crimeensis TaxID=2579147 RepID=A0ABT0DBY3_9HYPH|nr:type II toxin-antitoxin system RelE/ParE family toxin [Ancylobacter crimeensis]MCK0197389.1 type II toxin-antitoxin system RelE/ParE family toxin [Ancylobacter crimeensis]
MWTVEYLPAAQAEEAALPLGMQARLGRMLAVIRQNGFQDFPRDWVKPLEGKLWELRITGRDGIARAIYVTAPAGGS